MTNTGKKMKKYLYLLLLPMLALFAACSDDDDKLPNVDFTITMSNVAQSNNTFYAVKGDVVTIDQVAVKSLTSQNAAITGVRYFLSGVPLFGTMENPFSVDIPTESLEAGKYTINVTCTVLQVDKRIATAALNFPFVVVETADDLPDGATLGTNSLTVRSQAD